MLLEFYRSWTNSGSGKIGENSGSGPDPPAHSTSEFIDFSLLLPGNSDHPNFGPIRLSVEGDQGFSIPIPNFSNSGKRPKIDCIDKWLTVFGIYASVVVERFPHKALQLFAYQSIIREASQKQYSYFQG